MPVQPPWLDRVQFILFYAFNPCDAEASLYVEMAKEPFGKLALFILTPDLKEIVETFFTPKGLRSKRHGRKGRKGGKKGKFGIPDVDEMFASKLPGSNEMAGRPYGMGQRFFFSGIQALDRVTWPMVLIDQTTNAAFDTFMGVMLEKKDDCSHIGRMLRKRGQGNVLALLGWHNPSVGTVVYINGINSTNEAAATVFDGTYTVVFAVAWYNDDTTDREVEMRISFQKDGIHVVDHVGPTVVPAGEAYHQIASARVEGMGVVTYEYRVTGGAIFSHSAEVMILQIDGGII